MIYSPYLGYSNHHYSAIVAMVLLWPVFTSTTPVIVSAKPTAIKRVKGSPNKIHAMIAVVGGTK